MLDSERMINTLISYHNVLLKNRCFPKRWLDTLHATIGKEKGLELEKLSIITIIEVDLQHVIHVFFGDKVEEIIESDNRFSTANCSSRETIL